MLLVGKPHWKTVVRWLLFIALIVHFVSESFVPEDDDDDFLDSAGGTALHIARLKPLEVTPGSAVVVTVEGLEEGAPVGANLDKEATEVVHHRGDQVVVRVPEKAATGRLKLRITQGDRRSKGRDVWVRSGSPRKVWRNVLGGLALFVLGLRTLARALRAYTGHTLRRTLTRLTRSTLRGAALGGLAGAVTQSTVSTAGVLCGMLQSRLLGSSAALAALIGAQVGSLGIALLLPLGSGRDSVLLVALGVCLLLLAEGKRNAALAKATLGIGLLFFGLYLIRVGFQPLVDDPSLLPYFGYVQRGGWAGTATAAAGGVVLSAILQGPGPLFALVLGLAESTGILGLADALAVLAGSGLGTALGTAVVAWPFGPKARRLAAGHLVVGTAATLVMLVGIGVWVSVAVAVVPGDPEQIAYGKKVLLPNIGPHLSAAFLLANIVAYAPMLALAQRLASGLKRSSGELPSATSHRLDTLPTQGRFSTIIDGMTDALATCLRMLKTGDRALASVCEAILGENKRQGRALLQTLRMEEASSTDALGRNELACAFALVSCRHDIVQIQRVVETVLEEDLSLGDKNVARVEELHALLLGTLAALGRQVGGNGDGLEAARGAEISINAKEMEARLKVLATLDTSDAAAQLTVVLGGLLAAYEALGNHVYQAHEALTPDVEAELY